jgi:hypothetical protein
MENVKIYESFIEDLNEAKAQKGLMHKLLNIPDNKKIGDVYKSGEELAHDLLNAVKKAKIVPSKKIRQKATSMLAFAANWPSSPDSSVLDKALKSIKKIAIPGVPVSS